MSDFIRLPSTEQLVTQPEVRRLREKFEEAKRLLEADRFWQSVQERRQVQPVDFERLPA